MAPNYLILYIEGVCLHGVQLNLHCKEDCQLILFVECGKVCLDIASETIHSQDCFGFRIPNKMFTVANYYLYNEPLEPTHKNPHSEGDKLKGRTRTRTRRTRRTAKTRRTRTRTRRTARTTRTTTRTTTTTLISGFYNYL